MAVKLDDKDAKILELLGEHAEYATRQIAKKVNLPITTVYNRVKRLKTEGIIKKYTVEVDYSKLERNFVAYILVSVNLELLKHRNKSQYDLVNDIKKFYFVERVDIVAGGTDLVVIMRVKDVQEFDHCLLNKLQLIEGIDKTQALIVIHGR